MRPLPALSILLNSSTYSIRAGEMLAVLPMPAWHPPTTRHRIIVAAAAALMISAGVPWRANSRKHAGEALPHLYVLARQGWRHPEHAIHRPQGLPQVPAFTGKSLSWCQLGDADPLGGRN